MASLPENDPMLKTPIQVLLTEPFKSRSVACFALTKKLTNIKSLMLINFCNMSAGRNYKEHLGDWNGMFQKENGNERPDS